MRACRGDIVYAQTPSSDRYFAFAKVVYVFGTDAGHVTVAWIPRGTGSSVLAEDRCERVVASLAGPVFL